MLNVVTKGIRFTKYLSVSFKVSSLLMVTAFLICSSTKVSL